MTMPDSGSRICLHRKWQRDRRHVRMRSQEGFRRLAKVWTICRRRQKFNRSTAPAISRGTLGPVACQLCCQTGRCSTSDFSIAHRGGHPLRRAIMCRGAHSCRWVAVNRSKWFVTRLHVGTSQTLTQETDQSKTDIAGPVAIEVTPTHSRSITWQRYSALYHGTVRSCVEPTLSRVCDKQKSQSDVRPARSLAHLCVRRCVTEPVIQS